MCPNLSASEIAEYRTAVDVRWDRDARADARRNRHLFTEHHDALAAWCERYHRDNWFQVGDKYHNSEGTVKGMLWLAAGNHDMRWLIDFCDHHQTCFLRRGAVAYCVLLIKRLEQPAPHDPAQMELIPQTSMKTAQPVRQRRDRNHYARENREAAIPDGDVFSHHVAPDACSS